MKDFIYTGPISSAPLPDGDKPLFPGERVNLPEDNPYVRTLIAKKHLVDAPPKAATATASKRTATTTEKEE